jgi:hypothetical protein
MKSFLLKIGNLLLPTIFLFSCAEDEKLDSRTLQLTFSFTTEENNGSRTTPVDLPGSTSILISLETNSGAVVLEQLQMSLRKEGETYVSEPLDLPVGNYKVTDFLIVDDGLDVLYATPRKGSPLSAEIAQSLPYSFISAKQGVSDIRIQVLDARMKPARNFGYSSFIKNKNSVKLQVFIPMGNKLQPTTAEALIMKGLDTLKMYPLSAKMNTITFDGDPGETYTLVVVKDSYSRFARDFTIKDLVKKLKLSPLKVVLDPALTVVAIPSPAQNYFSMQLDIWGPGEFDMNVDWGDGTKGIWRSGITTLFEHYYQEPGKYFISITGHRIDSTYMVGDLWPGDAEIERLGMDHLKQLVEFRMEWADGPKVIDLSHSTEWLGEIRINNAAVEDLRIPDNARLYIVELAGNKNLTSASLNEIINDLHHQVVTSPPHGGDFYFYADDYNTPVSEPSPEAWEKLRELKHTYGWLVIPDPDFIPM